MLKNSDRDLAKVITALASKGVEAGYLVPTPTGLNKCILDAHEGLRLYLRNKNYHDYATQAQGAEGRIQAGASFLLPTGLVPTTVSVYRPLAKRGDPRIWFSGLSDHCRAGNLLAVFVTEAGLVVANVSNHALLDENYRPTPPFERFLQGLVKTSDKAIELLSRLRNVAARGFTRSLRPGPTGIGYTLETLLGIQANSSRAPDFHGIEIKASRTGSSSARSGNRITLFSRIPDWNRSFCSSGTHILREHGYRAGPDGRLQLYCSLNHVPNSLGHFLAVEEERGSYWVHAKHRKGDVERKVIQWSLEDLQEVLSNKHQETFWVKARVKANPDGTESFHYIRAEHTTGPLVSNLGPMLSVGRIQFDYTLSQKGAGRCRDHGYLFKIHPSDMAALFPPPRVYDLLQAGP